MDDEVNGATGDSSDESTDESPDESPKESPEESPSFETSTAESTDPPRKRSGMRRALTVAAVVAAAVVLFGALFALRRAGGPDYDETVRENFLTVCVADGGEPVRPVCECVWEVMEAEIPFERFMEVDRLLAEQVASVPDGTPLDIPDDIGVIVRDCVESS